jgi:lipoprotein-anchoring transpeptidase ErfK/SrfK
MRHTGQIAFMTAVLWACSAGAAEQKITADKVNAAELSEAAMSEANLSPLAIKVQVLLDRAHVSPGEIDGRFGENTEKALRAFAAINGLPAGKKLTPALWDKLNSGGSQPPLTSYTLQQKDVEGHYLDRMPAKMEDMKSLKALDYTSPLEALGERFHMSPELLQALNPGVSFDKAGTAITIVDVGSNQINGKVARVEVNKALETVTAFDKDGNTLAFFPASVGSEEKPTPGGTLKVVGIQPNPTYRYDPKYKFKGVSSTKPFTIRPGPNNPVGSMWIGLSEKSYGIHGTAEPSKVSKAESHGCVRLTNWDVQRLAKGLSKGVPVAFVEGK